VHHPEKDNMAGLIINHDTKYIGKVIQLFKSCDVMHWQNFNAERAETYDYIVLSGGPIDITGNNILEEKEWLKNTNKPILGICLGLQILCLVYDETLTYNTLPANRKLNERVTFLGEDYNMFYNHMYYFNQIPKDFVGEIHNGILIYMRHKTKPILAFQGHPEMTEKGEKIKDLFLNSIVK
jgi:GMP synthase-like glutamine amidotransferase